MKIINLHIENIRGIKEIDLHPNGKNFVIFGPNGTGKSAVVDALDFLFTGTISRLSGEGTSGLSLKKHGCHVDSQPKNTTVRALIQHPNTKKEIEIERSISSPDNVRILKGDKNDLGEILAIAKRGQHVLSRRDILRYVAAKKGERAIEIQNILNLNKVENLRKLFVTVENELSKLQESAERQLESSYRTINIHLGLQGYKEEDALKKINTLRESLKGNAINNLNKESIKSGLNPPEKAFQNSIINPNLMNSLMKNVLEIMLNDAEYVYEHEKIFVSEIQNLIENKNLRKELKNLQLLQLGITLLDDTGICPLCEAKWNPEELKQKIESRLTNAKNANEIQKNIIKIKTFIEKKYTNLKDSLCLILSNLKAMKMNHMENIFNEWINQINLQISDIFDEEKKIANITERLGHNKMFAPQNYKELFEKISKSVEVEAKKHSPEQIAWDTLTKLELEYENLENKKEEFRITKLSKYRATLLKETYQLSRDKVLNALYKKIETDFIEYYKFLHGEDEKNFEASLIAQGAELLFDVDFYGRGKFPPIAYHSEGHQDSMGVCLYLALMKILTQDKVQLTVLDDVVMSIDTEHRRSFSKLISAKFSDRQFLITTHNRTWAYQLKTDGVVANANLFEFTGWSVDTGPICMQDKELWTELKELIEKNNISVASSKLRKNLEFFFQNVCESLQTQVIFKQDARYELGDLLGPGIGSYKKLIKKAKESAKSWDDSELVEQIAELETIANEIYQRTQVEQWGINTNVHYSSWSDFNREDFIPIVEAFHDLFDLFTCKQCGGLLYISGRDKTPQNLRCPCGKIILNLINKKDNHSAHFQ